MKNAIKLSKYFLFTLLVMFLLSSCNPEKRREEAYKNIVKSEINRIKTNYKVIVIDSCEYIYYHDDTPFSGNGYLAHKGNCRFCAERARKLQEKKEND